MMRLVQSCTPAQRDLRSEVADRAEALLTTGELFGTLRRRIAHRTVSTAPDAVAGLRDYLTLEMQPEFAAMGFECRVVEGENWGNPMLIARRVEDPSLPTIFGYGHGDVVEGDDAAWSVGLDPWDLTERNGAWYGRGIVDNKGQHSINIAAMRTVLEMRGKLGFNCVWLIEMGEETGSPGLRELCETEADSLMADILIASDGPRVSPTKPTLYLGTRGAVNFTLSVDCRENGHHSGNWGGLLANPAIMLAHAIGTLTTARGQILIPGWTPPSIPEAVRLSLATIEVNGGPDGPTIAADWGEPGLTAAEQLYGWSSFDVLAFTSGTPERPVNAVPPSARAHCQIRTVVGVDEHQVIAHLRHHLDEAGFSMVRIDDANPGFFATRLDPSDPWVRWVADTISRCTGKPTSVLPNVGGSLPNDVFAHTLGMRTIWIPHSYPGAQNHGADEHLPLSIAREALRLMAILYWDLGDQFTARPAI